MNNRQWNGTSNWNPTFSMTPARAAVPVIPIMAALVAALTGPSPMAHAAEAPATAEVRPTTASRSPTGTPAAAPTGAAGPTARPTAVAVGEDATTLAQESAPASPDPTSTGNPPAPSPSEASTARATDRPVALTAAAPAATATEAPAPASAPLPSWLKSLNIGAGAILWYYQPVDVAGANHNVDLFFANILLDGKLGAFGLHIEPRFRDSRLRAFFPGPVWAQEVYASAALGANTVLKAGKTYSHLGLFWDNSFYGNVQVYDGLKLDPDYGLSLEGAVRPEAEVGLRYWAQFFLVDGQTNVSLDGRDTISIPGARRRNQAILRVEPFWKITEHATVTAGLSGESLQADLAAAGKKNVFRAAADATVTVRRWALWAEVLRQNGQTVTDFPIAGTPATATTPAVPGRASSHNNYGLAGTQYTFGALTVRYNVSTGRYQDLSISEWMHVPAAAWALNDNVTVLGEYVHWTRYAPADARTVVDRSFDLTLAGHF